MVLRWGLIIYALFRPALLAAEPFQLLVTGCIDQDKPQPLGEQIRGFTPTAAVLLGDNIYSWTNSEEERFLEYQKLTTAPWFVHLRRVSTVLPIWDDNDMGEKDGGLSYPERESSKQTFLRVFQVPLNDPRWSQDGLYFWRDFHVNGGTVRVIVLDTRFNRTDLRINPSPASERGPYLPHADISAQVLGSPQWKWLEGALESRPEFTIVVSSIQILADESGFENWGNFPNERTRLLDLVRGREGVLLISGDRHSAEISVLDNKLVEVNVGSLNVPREPIAEPNRYRQGSQIFVENFGLMRLDLVLREGTIEIHTADGVQLRHKFDLPVPNPRRK